jgi:hypothetical protein
MDVPSRRGHRVDWFVWIGGVVYLKEGYGGLWESDPDAAAGLSRSSPTHEKVLALVHWPATIPIVIRARISQAPHSVAAKLLNVVAPALLKEWVVAPVHFPAAISTVIGWALVALLLNLYEITSEVFAFLFLGPNIYVALDGGELGRQCDWLLRVREFFGHRPHGHPERCPMRPEGLGGGDGWSADSVHLLSIAFSSSIDISKYQSGTLAASY